jgi:hypothetical protein
MLWQQLTHMAHDFSAHKYINIPGTENDKNRIKHEYTSQR